MVLGTLCGLSLAGCIRGGVAFEPNVDDVDETRYGSIAVVVETTGANPDPNGYVAHLDESQSTPVPTQGETAFTSVAQGYYSVRLDNVDPPCAVQGTHPFPVYVFPDSTAVAAFTVDCP
jgi:hypothetical protein